MGCNDCQSPNLQGTQYCQECMPDESSVIIPDTIVPDPFLMDRNHIYLLPNGESYILNYDRTQAIKLGGSGGSSVDLSALEDKINKARYDDTELRNKINELSNKQDKDTIYDDTELRNKVSSLENKQDKNTITKVVKDDSVAGNQVNIVEETDGENKVYKISVPTKEFDYKFFNQLLGLTTSPKKENGNLVVKLDKEIDINKDKVFLKFAMNGSDIYNYNSNSKERVSNYSTTLEIPLNNSNKQGVSGQILLPNGDTVNIYLNTVLKSGNTLTISDFKCFLIAGGVLGTPKTIEIPFFRMPLNFNYNLNGRQYSLDTKIDNQLIVYAERLVTNK